MEENKDKKEITLDELATMIANGFSDVQGQIADIRNTMATKDDLEKVRKELKEEITGLRNSVNNYLRLSDERYGT